MVSQPRVLLFSSPLLSLRCSSRHAISLGDEKDLHAIHWHGQTVLDGGHRTDVLELMPASAKSVDMVADNVSTYGAQEHLNTQSFLTFVFI